MRQGVTVMRSAIPVWLLGTGQCAGRRADQGGLAGSIATAAGAAKSDATAGNTLALLADAARQALAQAGLEPDDLDGLVIATRDGRPDPGDPPLLPALAARIGLAPSAIDPSRRAGTDGLDLIVQAARRIRSGRALRMLVVAGTGTSRSDRVGLPPAARPLPSPGLAPAALAAYARRAAHYLQTAGATEADLADLAVLMGRQAAGPTEAGWQLPLTRATVLASEVLAAPLKRLDCCAAATGACALVLASDPGLAPHPVRLAGLASDGAARALAEAGWRLADVELAGVQDESTISLALLIESIGLAPLGGAGRWAADGHFDRDGALPLNADGGLLAQGRCPATGALPHLIELHRQLTGLAGMRQVSHAGLALLHGHAERLSATTSLVLEAVKP